MAKTTRVHILAKELGVKSKAIVDKCQAEGLDVKNHMSTISVGLAATIREWFSEGEHATTVETAQRVDLKKVRIKRKTARTEEAPVAVDEQVEIEEAAEAGVAVESAAALDKGAEAEAPSMEETAAAVVEAEPAGEEAAAVETAKVETEVKAEAKAKKTVKKKEPKKEEKKPEPIVPAGPMLEKPKPAQLSGPRVVRVEEAEPIDERRRRPKPRAGGPSRTTRPTKPRYDQPISEPLVPADIDLLDVSKGKKGKGRGRKKVDEDMLEERSPRLARKMRARDLEDRRARLAAARGESFRSKPVRRIETKKVSEVQHVERPEKALVSEPITVKDLSSALMAKSSEIIAKLMEQGVLASANQVIPTETAELIALELGTELIVERKEKLEEQLEKEFAERERKNLQKRSPVVTMLGHVDHGKTSLLDRIRSSSVASGEAGGITQHIGAYQVEWKGRKVTFLDTPGHEAFTAMRARGANMTDIVVLVVAADDGVMPQTVEAIHHAKAAGVEILVAINKIDLSGVDLNRVYGQLAEHELTPSEWGGDTEIVKTSATTGEGIEELIEHLDYIADLKDYNADSTIPAMGWVIEAKMTSTQGAVATLLIKEGVLNKGDIIAAGTGYGRIRTLKDSRGKSIKKAISSVPVEVSGLNGVPQAGDKFFCVKDINRAKQISDENKDISRKKALSQRSVVTLDNLFTQIEAGNIKELNIIIKADVQGSVDVLIKYLTELSTDEIKVRILHAAVGGINEGDVVLAEASDAIIIGFNVVPDERVRSLAESSGVDIRLYNVIYRITEDLKAAMEGMLEPDIEERLLGRLEVRNTFKVSSIGTIAGCFVSNGVVTKNAKIRLIRDGIVIKDNCTIESLKHFKDDAREVKSGLECGIKIAGFDDIKINDAMEAYETIEVARTL